MDGRDNEWAVAFHGVGDSSYYPVPKIAKEGLKIGMNNVYTGKTCVLTGKIIKDGAYCTPFISVAEAYARSARGNSKDN